LKLPNLNEFSPAQAGELRPLLLAVATHAGQRLPALNAIVSGSARISQSPPAQRLQRAANVLIGMSQCGLVTLSTISLTAFGSSLASLQTEAELYDAFATHLLTDCFGREVLNVARRLREAGEQVTKTTVNDALRFDGFELTTNDTNAGKLRQWLEKAKVVDANYNIDEQRYRDLVGLTSSTERELRAMSRAQSGFLDSLKTQAAGSEEWLSTSAVLDYWRETRGRLAVPESDLRKKVLGPLAESGWIETKGERRDGPEGKGRGGKAGQVRATKRLLELPGDVESTAIVGDIPEEVKEQLAVPISVLKTRLLSESKHEKGLALEVLAAKLARIATLTPVHFRLRSKATTGNAEVDLIAEAAHLQFSRWLFQCKNTPGQSLRLDDLAKEIGLAFLLRAHVVVMVTTGLDPIWWTD
jgi:hypothetical protein